MGKYEPLGKFLRSQTEKLLPLTFEQVEQIIGTTLPASKQYPAWWSNNTGNNVMTQIWLDAGFQTESVDTIGEKLVFRRVTSSSMPGSIIGGTKEGANKLRTLNVVRHPAIGCMEGTVTIAEGVDPTDPACPEWEELFDEKYPPK